jgi:trehalose 6-phosphate synthase/phosphatase
MSKTLANLPYRTIEIDVATGAINLVREESATANLKLLIPPKGMAPTIPSLSSLSPPTKSDGGTGTSTTAGASNSRSTPRLSNGVIIDSWNVSSDFTYYPYIIRDVVNKQNKVQKQMLTRLDSYMTAPDANNANIDAEPLTPDPTPDVLCKLPSRVSFLMDQDADAEMTETNQPQVIHTPPSTSGRTTPTRSLLKVGVSNLSLQSPARPRKRIFFVCYHLPVIVTRDPQSNQWEACWSESLLAATEGSEIIQEYDAHWVGTVTSSSMGLIQTDADRQAVTQVLNDMRCTPIFLEEGLHQAHYLGMCKQVLWPAFHNIDLLDLSASGFIPQNVRKQEGAGASSQQEAKVDGSGNVVEPPMNSGVSSESPVQMHSEWDQSRLDGWWYAYTQVNEIFNNQLASMLQPGDIMWVHDYHLSLLPKLMDETELDTYSRLVTKKVFLLHIPFPTSQVFRELECGEAILEGMLHADVVGFHAFDHARHFLNAAKRILGLNYESLVGGLIGVQCKQKTVLVTMHNVSIEEKMVRGTY